jgi:hypothetical protein
VENEIGEIIGLKNQKHKNPPVMQVSFSVNAKQHAVKILCFTFAQIFIRFNENVKNQNTSPQPSIPSGSNWLAKTHTRSSRTFDAGI